MLRSEAIEKYWDTIVEAMRTAYADTVGGRTQEQIYIWSDGEIETFFGVYGDNSFLRPKQWEDRELFYIATVSAGDPLDFIVGDIEEMSETERAEAAEEAADWLITGYDTESHLDEIYEQAVSEERYEEEERERMSSEW